MYRRFGAALLIAAMTMTVTGCDQTVYGASGIDFGSASAQSEEQQYDADKVKGIYSANAAKMFVWADKMYLYDLKTGLVTAETAVENVEELDCRAIQGGYAVIVRNKTGNLSYSCNFYDESLKLMDTVVLDQILGGDLLIATELVGVSKDGKKLAAAGIDGLYLYDRKTKKVDRLIDFNATDEKGRQGIVGIEELEFAQQGNKIAFKAQSFSVPVKDNERSFDTCGWINVDGTCLMNKRITNYETKEITVYDNFLLLAEDFTCSSGRLMVMDMQTGAQKIHTLKTVKESGTVYGSDQGVYFATATLDDDLKVRVYDTATGTLIKEETITVTDPLYVARIPEIIISDHLKTCIVVLGNRQPMKTMVKSFQF